MDLRSLKQLYFLGIGGIGMSALARYFKQAGVLVSGYDKTQTPLTKDLEAEGIAVHYEEDITAIPEGTELVIYTPAIPKEHKELAYIIDKNIPLVKRSEVLGWLSKDLYCIAISGTHGKTSISCMAAHLLLKAGKLVNAFVGGISVNYKTNLMLTPNAENVVVEADEYDRSFLQLSPNLAVISAIDADHLDIYKTHEALKETFIEFAGKIRAGGTLIRNIKIPWVPIKGQKELTYGIGSGDYSAQNIRVENGRFVFDLEGPAMKVCGIRLGVPGAHNVENAVAATIIARLMGLTAAEIRDGLESYKGVQRRFETQVEAGSVIYIDDYAHHPEELRACITAARDLYPGLYITGIFQPHLFTRTRDLADDFSEALDLLDEVALLPIYPARELPIPGVTSEMLLTSMNHAKKHLVEKEEIPAFISSVSPGVLLTMGAGDIDQWVGKIKGILEINIKAGLA